jgi:hypothetical protein
MIIPVSMKRRRLDAAAPRSGRDEMNLAEFPIALLSHRASPETKTLRFEKSITSKSGRELQQKWVVTSTDAYGLPLAGDEELYLVLLELTRSRASPNVFPSVATTSCIDSAGPSRVTATSASWMDFFDSKESRS